MKDKMWSKIIEEIYKGFVNQFPNTDPREYEDFFLKIARNLYLDYLYETCPACAIYIDPKIIDATRKIK